MLDIAVLVAAPLLTWFLWSYIGSMAGIVLMAVGHFFLFCNVFRIHRKKELLWATVCILNVSAWAMCDALWWPGVLGIQTPLTVFLIWREMRGPWYHGIFARRINSYLDDYLEGRI